MSTRDNSSLDILSFMKSLSEKFDVLKEEVENLKKPNADKGTSPHSDVETMSNESSNDSSPNPARSRSRQAKRDRQKQKRERHSQSRAHSDYRSRSLWNKDITHVQSWADRMDEDPNEIPDNSQDPHFANSEEEEIQDSELLAVL